jgi:hypothetical protein
MGKIPHCGRTHNAVKRSWQERFTVRLLPPDASAAPVDVGQTPTERRGRLRSCGRQEKPSLATGFGAENP